MLPTIHLGALITVTDSHIANKNKEEKQVIMEARMNRNTEGFYVYQAYLKRLRRMHRAYLAKLRQQKIAQNAKTPNNSCSSFSEMHAKEKRNVEMYNKPQIINIVNESKLKTSPQLPRHRISMANHSEDNLYNCLTSETGTSSSITTHQNGHHTLDDEADQVNNKFHASLAIHIPCGRENSFDDRPLVEKVSKKTVNWTEEGLPFRLWKQKRDQTGTSSLYTKTTSLEKENPKVRVFVHKPKSILRVPVKSNWLFKK